MAEVGALTAGALAVALLGTANAQAALDHKGSAGLAISASSGSASTAAAPCSKLASANRDTVRVWFCDGTQGTARGYHAQAFMTSGGTLTLRSASGANLRSMKATHGGVLSQWYNTGAFNTSRASGGLYKACTGVCTAARA